MAETRDTLIGIVGYTPVLDCFPLGPRLMDALKSGVSGLPSTRVDNMSWSPIHIVQQFQDPGAARPERLVLIGTSAVSRCPGSVQAFRWKGGVLPEAVVQERVYEAVTGIVDIENTLMIGEYFGVWPYECYSIEADMQADAFGRMVIADSEGWADDPSLTHHLGFSPHKMVQEIIHLALSLMRSGNGAAIPMGTKSAATLAPISPFIRNHSVAAAEDDNRRTKETRP